MFINRSFNMIKFRKDNLELVKDKNSGLQFIGTAILWLFGLTVAGVVLFFLLIFLTMGVPSIG